MKANTVTSKYFNGDTTICGTPEAIASVLHGLLRAGREPARVRDDLVVSTRTTKSGAHRWTVCGVVVAMETKEREPRK